MARRVGRPSNQPDPAQVQALLAAADVALEMEPTMVDIDAGENLSNAKWEQFARIYAGGRKSAVQAYMEVYDCEELSAISNAHRMMGNDVISRRVSFLQRAGKDLAIVSLGELLSFYAMALRTPIEDITPAHPLAQRYKRSRRIVGRGEEAEEWEVEEIYMVDKLGSASQLAELLSYMPDKKIQVEVTTKPKSIAEEMDELIEKFRKDKSGLRTVQGILRQIEGILLEDLEPVKVIENES